MDVKKIIKSIRRKEKTLSIYYSLKKQMKSNVIINNANQSNVSTETFGLLTTYRATRIDFFKIIAFLDWSFFLLLVNRGYYVKWQFREWDLKR